MDNKKEKLAKLASIMKDVNKEKKSDTIIAQFANETTSVKDVIPTGSLGLDIATGIGGFPRGRIVEVFGDYSSSKTTLCLHAISECQKLGGIALFIDMESSYDKDYAEAIGVNNEELILCSPETAEEALNLIEKLVESNSIDMCVVDSVAAMLPSAEQEEDYGAGRMGLHAKLMSTACRKLTPKLHKHNVLLILINQVRSSLNMYSPDVTTGGRAIPFYSSMRIRMTKSNNKVGDEIVSNTVKATLVKNKCASPFTKCEFDVNFGEGIDKIKEILDIACKNGIIHKGGAWLTYGDIKVQGFEKFKVLMIDNPELKDEIETKVKQCLKENKEPAQVVETID